MYSINARTLPEDIELANASMAVRARSIMGDPCCKAGFRENGFKCPKNVRGSVSACPAQKGLKMLKTCPEDVFWTFKTSPGHFFHIFRPFLSRACQNRPPDIFLTFKAVLPETSLTTRIPHYGISV